MVFYYQNCTDLLCEKKKCSSDREKLLKFEAEGREFAKITRTLYSNSERSEQCLVFNRMLFKLVPGDFSYLIN
jgi:hypothetical protein